MARGLKAEQWSIEVTIPAYDFLLYLSDADYEKYGESVGDSVSVRLVFDFCPASREVGIMTDGMTLSHWEWSNGKYPEAIRDAVDSYLLDINAEERYESNALDERLSYIEDCQYSLCEDY